MAYFGHFSLPKGIKKMKHKLLKLGAATAISVTGLSAVSSLKPVAASTFKTAVKRVKIKYLPGKGVRIWTSYNSGRFMGYQAKDGTVWNVVKTAVDKHGKLWYMVGDNEWIQARYTVDVDSNDETPSEPAKKTTKSKLSLLKRKSKKAKKAKKAKKVKKATQIVNNAIKKNSAASSQAPSSLISLAKAQVGKGYVWGAVGPKTFDCSGLVQYVYAHAAGKNLPRTTYDQVKVGSTVSMNALKPGDLLFWGSTTAPYHVAIYVGNNQYVNAATPDQGVVLQTLSSYYYPSIAKRVL